MKSIRFSFLTQEDLLKLNNDPEFGHAKEFVVQGLAHKLGSASDDMAITTKPREAIVAAQKSHPEDYELSEIIDLDQKKEMQQKLHITGHMGTTQPPV